jgi:cell fate (sporulation/competence/biofilm development) regulator YlbF (YheA/YmcA/DUF963 family)
MTKENKSANGSNVRDDINYYANKLAELLAQSDEFAAYNKARENLQKNKDCSYLLADFRQQQLQLHLATLYGEDSIEDTQDFEQIYQDLAKEPIISDFLYAETRFYSLLTKVQQILGKDLELWSEENIALKTPQILN